jgi:hypothetical protein
MRSTQPGCFRLCSWSLWKALEEEGGVLAWFHTFGIASDCVLGLFGKLLRRRGVYWLGFIRLELRCKSC